jgi:hypothetical protein
MTLTISTQVAADSDAFFIFFLRICLPLFKVGLDIVHMKLMYSV